MQSDQKFPRWSSRSASQSSLHHQNADSTKPTNINDDIKSLKSTKATSDATQRGSMMINSGISNATPNNRQRSLVKLKKHASFASSAIIISPETSRAAAAGRNYSRSNLCASNANYSSISSSLAASAQGPQKESSPSINSKVTTAGYGLKAAPAPTTGNQVRAENLASASETATSSDTKGLGLSSFSGLRSAFVNNYAGIGHKQLSVDNSNSLMPTTTTAPQETTAGSMNPLAKTLLANKKLGPSISRLGLRRRRALTMDSDDSKGKRSASIREKMASNKSQKQAAAAAAASGSKNKQQHKRDQGSSGSDGQDQDQNNDNDHDDNEDEDSSSSSDSSSTSSGSTSDAESPVTGNNHRDAVNVSDKQVNRHKLHTGLDEANVDQTKANGEPFFCCRDNRMLETVLDSDGLEVTDIDTVRLDHQDYQYLMKCMQRANDENDHDDNSVDVGAIVIDGNDNSKDDLDKTRKKLEQLPFEVVPKNTIVDERRHSDFNVGLVSDEQQCSKNNHGSSRWDRVPFSTDMSEKICQRLTNSVRLTSTGSSDLGDISRKSLIQPVTLLSAKNSNNNSQDKAELIEMNNKVTESSNENASAPVKKRHNRADYAWCPPNLTVQQIGDFFSQFNRDKIPYKNSQGAIHRDKQIWHQLPKQDISSDYCNYLDSVESLRAYQEFINMRNVAALDVAHIIQIEQNSNKLSMMMSQQLQQQTLDGTSLCSDSRKSSIISQSSLLMDTTKLASLSNILANIKCRRCLMRIELGQLAVVAPKFLIGIKSSVGPSTLTIENRDTMINSPPSQLLNGPSCLDMFDGQRHQQQVFATQAKQQQMMTSTNYQYANGGAMNYSQVGLFHPKCFTCSTCKEFLVDLVYCIRDNKLYCLRHYGESIRPRCGTCEELIFSDEYSKAMSEDFHVDHFICRNCNKNLAGQRYVLKEEHPYCISCFELEFAHTCEDCRKPIGLDSRDLCYKDKHWHDACFVCHKCSQSLIDKPFGSKSDHVYCANCYESNFATRCDGCNNPFRAGSKKMEYRGRQWHDSCFCCCVCKNTIGSSSFIPKNDSIYCIKCYEDKYATRCTKCKNIIISGGVTFRNEPWHKECFNCFNCNKSLAGQRFTTRDSSTLDKTNQQQQQSGSSSGSSSSSSGNSRQQPATATTINAYCVDCYGQLFAKRCFACSQAITGFGGTKYVTFEDRNWHNDCFICTDCRTSLTGKGFITDGPDAILCSECAQAKLRREID